MNKKIVEAIKDIKEAVYSIADSLDSVLIVSKVNFEDGLPRVTNSGGGETTIVTHSNLTVAKMYSPGGSGAGTRIREEGRDWAAPDDPNNLPSEAYYSARLFIPQELGGRCNIWQWKQGELLADGSQTKRFLYALLTSDNGELILKTRVDEQGNFFQAGKDILSVEVALPLNKWFVLEAFYRWSKQDDGMIIFWLDGKEVLRIENIITQLDVPWKSYYRQWTVNNYHPKNESVIYVDWMQVSL